MLNWRDQSRAVKARVHETFRVRGAYFLSNAAEGTVVHVRPRIRSKFAAVDDGVTGLGRYNESDMWLKFDLSEVSSPMVNGYVVLGETEGYRLGASEPAYMGFMDVGVTRLKPAEASALWALRPLAFDEINRAPVFVSVPSLDFSVDGDGFVTGFSSHFSSHFWQGEATGDATSIDVTDVTVLARPDATITYRWFINDSEVAGNATASLTDGDLIPGDEVRVEVTATNDEGSTTTTVEAPVPVP